MFDRDKLPKELQNKDHESILRSMMDRLPDRIDKSEGHLAHDHLAPVAHAMSDMINFDFVIAISQLFPQFAVGQYLDWHGQPIGVKRRSAVPSTGDLQVVGKPLQLIPKGTIFATTPNEDGEVVRFASMEDVGLDEDGIGTARVMATTGGRHTNVYVGAVTECELDDIEDVINEEPFTGGADEESDEGLRERIIDQLGHRAASGNVKDYERWAKEIDGVGKVSVRRLWNGPKTVKVLITNADGGMASKELVEKVQNHIDPSEHSGEGKGLAPVGAHVTVVTVRYVHLNLDIEATFDEACTNYMIVNQIEEAVNKYARGRSVVRYHSIVGVIVNLPCVTDLITLTINGQSEDVELEDEDEVAILGELTVNGKQLER